MDPLITVITPTVAARQALLIQRCLPSVERQTHPAVEHLVISDGPDAALARTFAGRSARLIELGRNWRQLTAGASYGAMPRAAGALLARGEFVTYVDDDDELLPDHCSRLLALLQREGADFVISQFRRYWSDGREPDVVGHGGIEYGCIGTPSVLHRVECFRHARWDCHGYAEDFTLFKAWADAGLRHAFLPAVTSLVHKQV